MTTTAEKRYTAKELASELRRHVKYVYSMKRLGFQMPGGTATLEEAHKFLARCPVPRAKRPVVVARDFKSFRYL